MFQVLPESSGRLVALRVSGKLTEEDMVSVAPPLEKEDSRHREAEICSVT